MGFKGSFGAFLGYVRGFKELHMGFRGFKEVSGMCKGFQRNLRNISMVLRELLWDFIRFVVITKYDTHIQFIKY